MDVSGTNLIFQLVYFIGTLFDKESLYLKLFVLLFICLMHVRCVPSLSWLSCLETAGCDRRRLRRWC